jgi:hypothetical protein
MASIQATTSPELSATTITSPKMLLSNTYYSMNEYAGSVALNNGASVNLLCNGGGYMRMIGLCNFFNFTTGTWRYGIFEFDVSRYGLQHTPILAYGGTGTYSISQYQEADVNRNWLVFTNTSGQNAISITFNIRATNVTGYDSSILTRIK